MDNNIEYDEGERERWRDRVDTVSVELDKPGVRKLWNKQKFEYDDFTGHRIFKVSACFDRCIRTRDEQYLNKRECDTRNMNYESKAERDENKYINKLKGGETDDKWD